MSKVSYHCNLCGVDVVNLQRHENSVSHQKRAGTSMQPVKASKTAPKSARGKAPKLVKTQKQAPPPQEYDEEDYSDSEYSDEEPQQAQGEGAQKLSRKEQSKFEKVLGERIVDLVNTPRNEWTEEDLKLVEFLKHHVNQ